MTPIRLMIAAAIAMAAASQAAAQMLFGPPETFVTAAPTPVLATPERGAPVLTTLPAGAGPFEAVRPFFDDAPEYARIALDEGDGWASLATLELVDVPKVDGTALPVGLRCGGTEPFWDLDLASDSAAFSAPWLDGADPNARATLAIDAAVAAEARGGHPAALLMSAPDLGETTAFIRAGDCSDGMSDRTYPWSAGVLLSVDGDRRLLEGCCMLASPAAR